MQKQVNFFEQHVQWFALGLGGLFLLFMVFTYVLGQPVKATAGSKELGPGEVDPATVAGPVKQLKQEIARTDVPEIPQKDYVESFVSTIQGTGQKFEQLAGTLIYSQRMEPIEIDTPVDDPNAPKIAKNDSKFPIVALPKLPAPRFIAETQGRSQVAFQDPKWEPDPRRPDKLPPMIEEDTDWWSGSFRVNAEQLAKAFEAAFDEKKIDAFGLDPNNFMKTALIDVELVRQELLPNGRFGNETIIQPLRNNPLRPPFPGKAAKDHQILEYLNWATANPQELVAPVFFEVLNGDPWVAPGEENERMAAMNREQRQQQREQARQQQRQAAQQRRQANAPGRGGFGGRPLGMPMGEDMLEMEGDFVPPPPPRFGGRGPVPPPQQPFNRFQRGARGVQPQQPGGVALAAGKNNDVRMLADIDVIAHDDSVEPGKTYRYKVRYKLYNPIYKRPRVAPPELSAQFALISADSAWTKPVTMRPKVEFYLAGINSDGGKFDVFEWEKGQMKKNTIQAAPGDAIGETGWSMVDVRGTGRKAYLMVMDEAGQVVRRDPDKEKESLRYQDLLDEVEFSTNPQVGLR